MFIWNNLTVPLCAFNMKHWWMRAISSTLHHETKRKWNLQRPLNQVYFQFVPNYFLIRVSKDLLLFTWNYLFCIRPKFPIPKFIKKVLFIDEIYIRFQTIYGSNANRRSLLDNKLSWRKNKYQFPIGQYQIYDHISIMREFPI